ncbi:hypothetical protein ACQF36_22375 [Streptomyces sp. Marseille-Q5077]|uniref:hypothetical protein n=1 Tax=Streptomyces sp. Marseille-Q5077 TaxID=3418995 RepID=UPI003D07CFFB
MISGSICRGLAYMPDEDLAQALTRPESLRVASTGNEVTVWADLEGMTVRAQRVRETGWLAVSLTFKETGTGHGAAMMGYLMLPAPDTASRTLDHLVSQLQDRLGPTFDRRLTLWRG